MVKGAVLERQGERVRLSDLDPVGEAAAGGQDAGYFDELRREVDRHHPATAFGREIAGRAAEAATDLEHVHSGLYARSFRMLAGCRDAPAVSWSNGYRSRWLGFSGSTPAARSASSMRCSTGRSP